MHSFRHPHMEMSLSLDIRLTLTIEPVALEPVALEPVASEPAVIGPEATLLGFHSGLATGVAATSLRSSSLQMQI